MAVKDPFPVLNIHDNPVWIILLSQDVEMAELCYQEETLFHLQQEQQADPKSSVNLSFGVISVLKSWNTRILFLICSLFFVLITTDIAPWNLLISEAWFLYTLEYIL